MIATIVICLCITGGYGVRLGIQTRSTDDGEEHPDVTCMKNLVINIEQRLIKMEQELSFLTSETAVTFNNVSGIYTGITCYNEKKSKISCPAGGIIEIVDADYGRSDHSTCSSGVNAKYLDDTDCHEPKTKGIVIKKCEGRNRCTVPVTTEQFGDPCLEIYKYLTIRFKCIRKTPSLELWNGMCSAYTK